jgi:upstream activation factor subunit UAF30
MPACGRQDGIETGALEENLMTKAPKITTTKPPAEKAAASKPASSAKPNALQKPMQLSEALAAVAGPGPMSRGEVVSKVWIYIKANNLQNPKNRREILADDKLRKVLGKDTVTMFEMNKHLAQHLT